MFIDRSRESTHDGSPLSRMKIIEFKLRAHEAMVSLIRKLVIKRIMKGVDKE